jgi:hypothetical protein
VEVKVDKLTSPDTMSAIDYHNAASCWSSSNERIQPSSLWKRSMEALHGDSFWSDATFDIAFKQDRYCQPRCVMDLSKTSPLGIPALESYEYHYWLDNVPLAYRYEDDTTVTTRYWSGIPIGIPEEHQGYNSRFDTATAGQVFLYNHYNFIIEYYQVASSSAVSGDDNTYRILRTTVEPFSIQTASDAQPNPAVQSCQTGATRHTTFDMLVDVPPQEAGSSQVLFTYDVIWREVPDADEKDYKSRWNVFLNMDHAQVSSFVLVGVKK